MSSNGKRRPPSDGPPSRRRRSRRNNPAAQPPPPPPPPPPPEPLVRLLQSDQGVLAYFQSLQANLDADVQRWKDRATSYKEKYEQLQAQLSAASPPKSRKSSSPSQSKEKKSRGRKTGSKTNGSKSEKKSNIVVSESVPEPAAAKETNGESQVKEGPISIDDAIMDALEEESSDESVDVAQPTRLQEAAAVPRVDLHKTYNVLCEAFECLRELGVSLVTEKIVHDAVIAEDKKMPSEGIVTKTDEGSNMGSKEDIDGTDALPVEATTRSLVRHSDHQVVADLMHALRTVTRVHLLVREANAHQPFSIPEMIPCCYGAAEGETADESYHPAAKALTCVFRALSIMDAYCGVVSDHEWNALFANESGMHDEAIRIGIRNRRNMVEMVMGSLRGEISGAWAVLDRSSRLITTALHYEPLAIDSAESDDNSKEDSTFQGFGAKSQSRLASLAERCIHAQLVSNMSHLRRNPQEASTLVWKYLLSATPSIGVEDYPRLPPVLSLCTMEALLRRDEKLLRQETPDEQDTDNTWFSRFLEHLSFEHGGGDLARRALVLSIHNATHIWKVRFESNDVRITDISRVEIASYERLLESESLWLGRMNGMLTRDKCRESAMSIVEDSFAFLTKAEEKINTSKVKDLSVVEGTDRLGPTLALQLALTITGDYEVLQNVFNRALGLIRETLSTGFREPLMSGLCAVALACCISFRQLRIRQVDSFRLKHGLKLGTHIWKRSFSVDEMVEILMESQCQTNCFWNMVSSIGKCCVQLSHGETLYRLIHWLVSKDKGNDWPDIPLGISGEAKSHPVDRENAPAAGNANARLVVVKTIRTLLNAGQAPTVRVINLRRRTDRMDSFIAQAQHEQILVVRAVASFAIVSGEEPSRLDSVHNGFFWGLYAFDGQGRAAEVDEYLSREIGDWKRLKDLVDTHWRPNDLKAFDKDARNDEALVMSSPSERACALSHIASWAGVSRSLSLLASGGYNRALQGKLFPHPDNFLRLFRVSGFVSGPPLLVENERLPPAPVCVILEDDAILVDRFTDRLLSVLEELPRDFHFCSLGYSRPKTAPMVKFSSQLGIPTCTWYLTGYVLSLEGAKFLMDSLPVKGPIDSWIGLKMCANWDNVFGHRVGVGVHSRPLADMPPRKDLVKILRFRAFAALVPLCSQKVGTTSAEGTVGRTWRQRDTDIMYSGNF